MLLFILVDLFCNTPFNLSVFRSVLVSINLYIEILHGKLSVMNFVQISRPVINNFTYEMNEFTSACYF